MGNHHCNPVLECFITLKYSLTPTAVMWVLNPNFFMSFKQTDLTVWCSLSVIF